MGVWRITEITVRFLKRHIKYAKRLTDYKQHTT